MLKKTSLLLLLMFAQLVFLFTADRVQKKLIQDQVSLVRQTLPAQGVPSHQVDALADVMRDTGWDAASHILFVATMLVMFNTVTVFVVTAKRE